MNLNVENTILGIILSFKDYQQHIISMLTEELFCPINKIIFRTIVRLNNNGRNIDLLTLTKSLTKDELNAVGGAYYITQLTSSIGSGSYYEDYVRQLKEDYIRSKMIERFQFEINQLTDNLNDISESYQRVNAELEKLFTISDNNLTNVCDIIQNRLTEISNIEKNKLLGVNTGHSILNKITGGWQVCDFIVIASRPSMGKTALALYFAKYAVLDYHKVLFFSLEMSKERLIDRILSYDTQINSRDIINGNIKDCEWEKLENMSLEKYVDKQFLIDDTRGQTMEQITATCFKEMSISKIGLIIIDYIQLIRYSIKSGTTNDQVAHISASLKTLAGKMKCPVIALSQLSRDVEKRQGDKRPQLSDLRDSGALEQDADIVIFPHRLEYYGITEDYEGKPTHNVIDLVIRKHRNGDIGETKMYKNDEWSYLGELSYDEFDSLEIPFNYFNVKNENNF